MEYSSCPKPRPIVHPRPFKSPDPWGGWNKAHNKASAQRHEKRVSEYLQRLEEGPATVTSTAEESTASSAASENPSAAALAATSGDLSATLEATSENSAAAANATAKNSSASAIEATSTCPTIDTGPASTIESNENGVHEESDSQMSYGSDRRNAYATTLIRIGFNPASPSFNDQIREAKEFDEKLKEDDFDIDDVSRSPDPSHFSGPPGDLPPGSPPIEDPPNPGSEPDPEDSDPDSDSSPPPSPTLNRTFQYKFYKNWSVYWGPPIRTGNPTAVDRLTSFRRFGEGPWKPVPNGFVVPRLDNRDEHEKDATRIETQLATVAAERQISREEARRAAIEEGEREKAEFAAKEKSDRKPGLIKPKLVKMPLQDGYQTPSESEGSGSDYSATEKANSKKRPVPSSTDDSDTEAVSDTPKVSSRPKKQVKLQPITPALLNGHHEHSPSVMRTGRPQSTTPKTGRPNSEQLEYCRAIRTRFDAEIKKAARMFKAREVTILKQVGLGGASIHHENNLYNLFTSARKKEQTDTPRTGMCLSVASVL